jgi:dynein heavy chain
MNIDEDRKFWQSSDDLRQLSNIRTERGKKRILRGNQDQLDVDPVQRYRESMDSLQDILNDIKNKPTQKPESFIIIDCSKLKQSLIDYGQDFIQQIFHHLAKESKEDLNSLLTEFVETVEELKQPTTKLDHLKKNRAKYYAVMQKKEQMKARIEPIKSKFNFIKENDQDIGLELNEEENQKLEGIDEAWTKFNDGLEEAKVIIDKYTTQLKTEMDNTIEDFKKEVKDNEKNFMNQAPYTVDGKSNDVNARAFEKLTEFAMITKELRDKEEENKFGLDIFGIEPQPYSEITKVEKQIALLREIWNIKAEWDDQWNEYKVIQFGKLQMGLMDDRAFEFFERLRDIDKEIKMWNVYEFLKQKIDVFRSTCPLIVSLRHESMRPRHWKELRFEVKEDFDEGGEDFTLEKIFELQLINHAEKIGDICANAEKQLTIETQLEDIKKTWTEDVATDLDIIKKKSRADNEEYYKINSTDNIIAIIEDHSVKLSTMKSSAYYRQFDDSIDLWESNIA